MSILKKIKLAFTFFILLTAQANALTLFDKINQIVSENIYPISEVKTFNENVATIIQAFDNLLRALNEEIQGGASPQFSKLNLDKVFFSHLNTQLNKIINLNENQETQRLLLELQQRVQLLKNFRINPVNSTETIERFLAHVMQAQPIAANCMATQNPNLEPLRQILEENAHLAGQRDMLLQNLRHLIPTQLNTAATEHVVLEQELQMLQNLLNLIR